MPEFPDIMLAVAQRDRIQAALRRLAAHQRVEAVFAEHLGHRAQPVGAFRMSRRRGMVEAGRMRQQQVVMQDPGALEARFARSG